MSFHEGQLKQQICYRFSLLISYMLFNPLKMAVQLFKTASNFRNLDDPNGPDFRKVGKSLNQRVKYYNKVTYQH